MVGGGGGQVRTFDIVRQFKQTVASVFGDNKTPCVCPPNDGPVLKLHYFYSFCISMLGFATIWYSWLHRDVIVCASHFNADLQVRLDYVNICLSFPYITLEDGSKQYLLYYRWVHWILFIVACAFYLPKKFSKLSEHPKLNKLIEYLGGGVSHYEGFEQQMVVTAARYLCINVRTHDSLYYRYVYSHVFGLFINISVFLSLDAVLLNNYASLGYEAYPYTRDGQFLTDPLTKAFPPFVECSIGEEQMLANKRTEKYGCHLTSQEFYEKLFLAFWFWQIFLMIITTLYIVYLLCFLAPAARRIILKLPKPAMFKGSLSEVTLSAGKNFKVGDWFLLHRLRNMFSGPGYCELLKRLADGDYQRHISDSVRKELPIPTNIGFESPPNKGILVE